MEGRFLEVTYRGGKALAAYLYLTDDATAKSHRSKQVRPGLVLDYGETDELIGIEITSPGSVTPETVNEVLVSHRLEPVADIDLSPLQVA